MKTCPKCHTDHADSAVHCILCGASLETVDKNINAGEYVEEYLNREEQKEKRKRRIPYLALGLFTALYIALSVMYFVQQGMKYFFAVFFTYLLCAVFFLFSAVYPKVLFIIEHFTKIENIDTAEPSEWYYISSKIGGYIILVLGIVFLLRLLYSF